MANITVTGAAKLAGRVLASLALAVGLYFFAALIGGLIGANPAWREPDRGVTVYVETNGVHTALVLPTRNAQHDWTPMLPASDLSDPRYAGQWLSFSWGNRRFYLETETWDDLQASTIFHVLGGSDETLIHVYHYQRPWPGKHMRKLTLTEAQYDGLVRRILARFADPDDPQPIAGYGPDDVFYKGRGNYTLINTCNSWTGRTLRQIGVRVGIWTPLAGGVMRWFPDRTIPTAS